MEEVNNLIEQAFKLAAKNGVLIDSIKFKHGCSNPFGPINTESVTLARYETECRLLKFPPQPV